MMRMQDTLPSRSAWKYTAQLAFCFGRLLLVMSRVERKPINYWMGFSTRRYGFPSALSTRRQKPLMIYCQANALGYDFLLAPKLNTIYQDEIACLEINIA